MFWCVCVVVVLVKIKIIIWQVNLFQYCCQNYNYLCLLFIVLYMLYVLVSNNLCFVCCYLLCQFMNGFGINVGQFFSLCGIFWLIVFFIQQIWQELFKIYIVVSKEVFVVQVFIVQCMCQCQLQWYVSLWVNCNVFYMFVFQIFMGGCDNWIDVDDFNFIGGDFCFQLCVIFINIVIWVLLVCLLVFQ